MATNLSSNFKLMFSQLTQFSVAAAVASVSAFAMSYIENKPSAWMVSISIVSFAGCLVIQQYTHKHLSVMSNKIWNISSKVTFIEERLDYLAAQPADAERHVRAELAAFDVSLGDKTVLVRRMSKVMSSWLSKRSLLSWRLLVAAAITERLNELLQGRLEGMPTIEREVSLQMSCLALLQEVQFPELFSVEGMREAFSFEVSSQSGSIEIIVFQMLLTACRKRDELREKAAPSQFADLSALAIRLGC